MQNSTRRSFIKGVGLAVCASSVPGILAASETEINKSSNLQHKILCCNIRVALDTDESAGVGWSQRKDICIRIIKNHKPDILCLQEVLRVQNEDLKVAFPDHMSYGFEGPEMDAFKEGYHGIAKNPILFSTKKYELLSAGGFWLSETPLVAGSKSWDTNRARHVNWVRLKDKKTGTDFRVLNLHLDHKSQEARVKQTQMVLEESKQYPVGYPQIFTGDFNASAANDVHSNIRAAGWEDTYAAIHGDAEPGYTVHLFKGDKYEKKEKGKKIDFIYALGSIKALKSEILRDSIKGVYPSDHYFVAADIVLLSEV